MNTTIFEIIGQLALMIALMVLGVLSKRLGNATRAKAHYLSFFVAAALVAAGIVLRLLNLIYGWAGPDQLHLSLEWVFIYNGLPAIAITLGLISGWHYWSWLLAERD